MKPNAILHLSWIKLDKNKNFIPREGNVFDNFCGGNRMISYFDSMNTLYNSEVWINSPYGEDLAARFYKQDTAYKKEIEQALLQRELELNQEPPNEWFVTINCKPDITPSQLKPLVEKILSYNWVLPGSKAVIEYHTAEGGHAHTHMKIINRLQKAKTIEKIYAAAGIRRLISDRAKIQNDYYIQDKHDKYILGDKQESKMKNVILDRQMRDSLGIPHIFEK